MYIHVLKLYLYLNMPICNLITSVINFCNYILITLLTHPLHFNPPLNRPIQKCFAIQYEHNKYIVLIFLCKY